MAKVTTKKRSTLKQYSLLNPPKDFDNKKYAGRWVAEQRLNARSDGFESRGFQPYKDANGNIVKAGDLIWCFMTREDAELMREEKYNLAKEQMSDLTDTQAANDDRLNFELEQVGGKLESNVKITQGS